MTTKTAETNAKKTAATGTVRFHRVLKAPPERIYKAVLDPAANCKWLSPYGYTCTVHHIDAKVGGTFKMSFTNFSTGTTQAFGGKYLELKPGERIVATDAFDDPNLPGEIRTTYTFTKVMVGTEVNIVQEGIPAAIPPEACYLGWQESLEQLAKLVEPEIPDQ
ncbi:MAG: SRPBCC family protein [Candidatus Omnitrophica bacterium]|nr:SRPBCC family protein [Candidatus Omnitrophota bacterium]